jgi:hypothetical protein
MNRTISFVMAILVVLMFIGCDMDSGNGSNNDSGNGSENSNTIIGSWTITGGHIITFYASGAVTTNNLGTGTYGNGKINLSVPLGNSGTGSYSLSGNKLVISGFVKVGATNFHQLNGEWLKMK